MQAIEHKGVKYYTFEDMNDENVIHGVFTRNGGVSPHPWDSLNLGGTVGDSRTNVIENRRRVFEAIERPVETIYDAWQVHGTTVIHVDRPRNLDIPHIHGDILLTNNPDVTLLMRFADCVPILLYDPQKIAIGLVHAGWKGSIHKVAEVAVHAMQDSFGSRCEEIVAGIGPSICRDHYEVGSDVLAMAEKRIPTLMHHVVSMKDQKPHLDLWKLNEIILKECGIEKLQVADLCTACHDEEWYSHRKQNGKTGRFAVVMGLIR